MDEFKKGDRVRRTSDWFMGMSKGDEANVIGVCDDGLTLDAFQVGSGKHSVNCFELVTPKYRHGDVWSTQGMNGQTCTITTNGQAWVGSISPDESVKQTGNMSPHLHAVKFLYNVFDKEKEESATTDCEVPRLKSEYQELADDFEMNYRDSGCTCHCGNPPCGYCTDEGNPANLEQTDEAWEKEDNTKEATMPLTIIKTTTTILPDGTPEDEYMVNDDMFDDISDEVAADLIRNVTAEIKAVRVDAKDSKSVYLTKKADNLVKTRTILVGLLDARE